MSERKLVDLVANAEAVLFVSPSPVSEEDLGRILGITDHELIQQVVGSVQALYQGEHRGVLFQRVAGGIRFATASRCEPYVLDALQRSSSMRLSQAALEVLAIVAYRQPMTIPEINAVRGVNSAGVVETLLQRKLIRTGGKKHVVGRPFLYRTTKSFLLHFGMESLDDLPPLEEMGSDAAE